MLNPNPQLPPQMIFEIRDLKFATPATATRAGILYISEGRQWSNMVTSWLDRVAKPYAEKAKWKASHAGDSGAVRRGVRGDGTCELRRPGFDGRAKGSVPAGMLCSSALQHVL
jgi:hypothetical protein